jgi:flagellar hook protein FlgE
MASFYTSLSGLLANSQDLSVISNNLANLNTVGFKSAAASFQDLFYQQYGTSGDGNPVEIGVGTKIGSVPTNFTEGNIQTTGVPTDVAIQGNGFFVASDGGQQVFLRAGDFSVLSDGELVSSEGANVVGYQATNGVINTNATPGNLTIPTGLNSPPKATTFTQLGINLDSGTAVGGTFSTAITTYDSLGSAHVMTYNFTNTAAGQWNYSITMPAADLGQTGNPVTVQSGTLTFNGAGQLTTPAADVTGITVNNLADGANPLVFNWNLFDANGNSLLTQYSGASTASSDVQDGFASGSLTGFSIGSDGTIEGSFSNNETQALGQILIANFANTGGLDRIGQNEFVSTLASGQANIGIPGTGGRGTLTGGSLEQSNVNISTEFANLIVAESGYQANAKVVTTLDTVVQDTINLIQ